VSDWGNWSDCVGCDGGGKKTRTRTVTANPVNGGTECPVLTESQNCVNNEPCANDPECSFIRSDADLQSPTNIVFDEILKGGCCNGGCDCALSPYIKCGRTPGGHYIRTANYDYMVKNGKQAYVNNGVGGNIVSTMKLRNGQNIFGPCGNCGTNGNYSDGRPKPDAQMDKSSIQKFSGGVRCGDCKGGVSTLCGNAFRAVDFNGATPPPIAKVANPPIDTGFFTYCP
jgi:Thrombospondin type 1 domain